VRITAVDGKEMIKKAFCSILLLALSFTGSRASADDAALIDALFERAS
jgi:hypothetical protein